MFLQSSSFPAISSIMDSQNVNNGGNCKQRPTASFGYFFLRFLQLLSCLVAFVLGLNWLLFTRPDSEVDSADYNVVLGLIIFFIALVSRIILVLADQLFSSSCFVCGQKSSFRGQSEGYRANAGHRLLSTVPSCASSLEAVYAHLGVCSAAFNVVLEVA